MLTVALPILDQLRNDRQGCASQLMFLLANHS
jgi:hypothetical protein